MPYQKTELYFLTTLLGLSAILIFFIFEPFLSALLLAVIFATVFAGVHKKIFLFMPKNHGGAAILTTALVLFIIVVPVTLLSMQIFKESTSLYSSLVDSGGTGGISQDIQKRIEGLSLPFVSSGSLDVSLYAKKSLSFLIAHLGTIFSNLAKIMVGVFILFIALYYLFKDGHRLKKTVISMSPLKDVHDEAILNKLEVAINSVVRGSIAVGIVQGVLTAIGLTIFGVPNPVLWGSLAAIAALVPGFGTSLVLVPAILFLFFSGENNSAIGLFVWWVVAVGLVDNVLGPKIVGSGAKLHPFLVLLSVLGGVSFLGPLGFLFGPLVLSLFFAFLEIYSTIRGARN